MFIRLDNKLTQRAVDTSSMRSHNSRLLLELLWRAGELSRADLARESGLSRSTVSAIVADLLDAGIVSESHVAPSQGGRPPIVLRIEEDRFCIVGVELGASHITALRIDLRGRVRAEASREHPVEHDPAGSMALLFTLIDQVLVGSQGSALVGVGLAVPCPIDPRQPDRLSTRILPRWGEVRPGTELFERYGASVLVDNDANLGAVAERWWGAGQAAADFSYVKVATGVGSGHIFGGEVYRGAYGIAGEIGHTAIDPAGPPCRCGRQGCLEAMIGSASMVRRAREQLAAGVESALRAASPLTLGAILGAARAGDALALRIVGEAGQYLGIAVANLVNLLNPSLVVLGGPLTEAGALILEPMQRELHERALWTSIETTDVRVSALGHRAIALGAGTAVLHAALQDPSLFPVPGPALRGPLLASASSSNVHP
jgi:predicted NBD/HSP70 family sugar kinase